MSSWHSPGKIWNVGHAAIRDLFRFPCQIQEKIDGSFFAFGLVEASEVDPLWDVNVPGVALKVRSKGAVMNVDAPEAMFKTAVDTVKRIAGELRVGWTYRGECVAKRKHNSLLYDRTPEGFVILFDVCTDEETFLGYDDLKAEAHRLGLEVVPQLYAGVINQADELRRFLDTTSILGGQKIEGVVIKPLTPMYGVDGKLLMGKLVSEGFKEVHRKAWGESNPTAGDILAKLVGMYGTLPRFNKARIHLEESGKLVHDVKDIGLLIREVPEDILVECKDDIKEELFKYAWPHIKRGICRAIPDYYKDYLLRSSFEGDMNGMDKTGSGSSSTPGDSKQVHEQVVA